MKIRLSILSLVLLLVNPQELVPASQGPCKKSKLFTVQGVVVWSTPSNTHAFFYKAGLAVDADGAYRAYHPGDRLGLDALAHAGHHGNWWALVTDNGRPSGLPVVQGKSDPAPGFYVSTTALYDPHNPNARDPHRYVDAAKIPYVVLHPKALNHARLGDFATVVNLQNGKLSAAIVADESAPDLPVGEGSIALAKALGIDADPRRGGQDADIAYVIYPGSGNGKPRKLKDVVANSKRLFEAWGGLSRLKACSADETTR